VEKYCTAGQATNDYIAHHIACWIPQATSTALEYVTLNAFPLQQRLHKHVLSHAPVRYQSTENADHSTAF
jgi:hypothetical protein